MSTHTITAEAIATRTSAALDLKLEVVVLPVADVERAKEFYGRLGWRLDGDFADGKGWRIVQMTPPGSPCSVMFGTGFTTAAPGSAQGTFLVVDDVDRARAELADRGIAVSDVFHFEGGVIRAAGTTGRAPGRDPDGRSYFSFASFSDPDGNTWLIQEVTSRLPGRGFSSDPATLEGLLQEAEARYGRDAGAPVPRWSQWYAEYVVARERGRTQDDAAAEAAEAMKRVAATAKV